MARPEHWLCLLIRQIGVLCLGFLTEAMTGSARAQICPICGVPGRGWHAVLLPQRRWRHLNRETKTLRGDLWKSIMMHGILPPEVCRHGYKGEKAWVGRLNAIQPEALAWVGLDLSTRSSLPSQSVCLDMPRLMADMTLRKCSAGVRGTAARFPLCYPWTSNLHSSSVPMNRDGDAEGKCQGRSQDVIISYQHEFIFVAVPKTATHAIREALRSYLGRHDWEQCTLFEKRYFPIESLARIGHGHITSAQIQPFLLPGMWERFFKFCVVRNPYDRFVSYCYFMYENGQRMHEAPLLTMKKTIDDEKTRGRVLFRPQHEFVTDEDDRISVNYVAKYEKLQSHFDDICRRIRLPTHRLPTVNASPRPPYQECYDGELLEKVQGFYAKDFALFDYPVELV